MPRTIDLLRASKLPSNMMQFAAKGALSVPPDENIEILVYLANHNKVFGDLARMTLAGWDEKASLAAAANPTAPREVLDYLVSPENLRPALFPALLENPSVRESELAKFAISASRESIEIMLQSARVQNSGAILASLRSNPYLKPAEAATVAKLLTPAAPQAARPFAAAGGGQAAAPALAPTALDGIRQSEAPTQHAAPGETPVSELEAHDETIATYFAQNAAEISAEQSKPFQPVGGVVDLLSSDSAEDESEAPPANETSSAAAPAAQPVAPAQALRPQAKPILRENAMQKINHLDVKGRIQLALKGNKEERSLLIRDGTKVVALAVLEAPKLSDGEVEKFALQKNVLEAVLRQIPLKRRFMKNYIVVRNLVSNPRTPLDLGLGLMKHLLVQDLKNISANKEVSETVRKLALKMYKQKLEMANKK
jgi:hypothetical protein